nr:DUF6101 family protein [Lutibaculum baratangense]
MPGDRGRCVRPDPHQMPIRIGYSGRGRRGPVPQLAVIRRETVVIRRECEAGVPLYIQVPTRSYRGVVLSARAGTDGQEISLRLEHGNADLAVPLPVEGSPEDALETWHVWAELLGCPLLIEDADGRIHDVERRLGGLAVRPPRARRANRFFAERRPRFLTRRRVGGVATGPVLREDEIIARGVED